MLRVGWDAMGSFVNAAAATVGIALEVALLELPTSETAYREAVAQAARNGANAIMVGDNPDTMTNRALIPI